MTGQDLLYGLSYVEERFIAEAETAVLGRKIPWMKVLSVAACLCILLVGAFALENLGHKGAKEEAAPAAAVPEAMTETAAEEAAPKEEVTEEEPIPPYAVEEEGPSGELQQVPQAMLRILSIEDDSVTVIVEAVSREPTPLTIGMELTMIVDPNMVPGADREVQNDLTGLLADVQVEIVDGAYDAARNILYVAEVFFPEQ